MNNPTSTQKTLLIIDEAHNLPSRVESNSSKELRSLSLEALASELTELGIDNRLALHLRNLADECVFREGRRSQPAST